MFQIPKSEIFLKREQAWAWCLEALFTTTLAAVFMYLCAVGGGWLLGVHFGMEAVGVYMAMAMDECVRAVGMGIRWHSGRWQTKTLV